jgi:hypothetical protein
MNVVRGETKTPVSRLLPVSSGGGGNSFTTIDCPSGTDPVADSATDTLALTSDGTIIITGNSATDTIDLSTDAVAVGGTMSINDLSDVGGVSSITGQTGTGDIVRQTSPIIVTPTIANFTNAQHDHLDADDGGVLTMPAVGVANSSTVGQVLRVTGASTYAFGAVDLADTDAITGDLPFANLTQGSALSVLGVTGNATADNASIAAGSDHQVMRRSGTAVAFGAVNLASASAVTGVLPVANVGPGGSTTQLQYNNAGALAGLSLLTFDATHFLLGATTTTRLQFRDTGLYIYSSVDGTLDVVADTMLNLGADGDIKLVAAVERDMYPATAGKINFGKTGNEVNNIVSIGIIQGYASRVRAGSSTGYIARSGGALPMDNFADVSVGGAEADIYSYTTPADLFATNGDKVIASYGGNFVTVGTELTQLKVQFAGTTIWDSTAVAPATGTTSWRVYVEIIRVSSTVIRFAVTLEASGLTTYVRCTVGELTALTLSGTNVLKIRGASSGVGSGAGDIVGKMSYGMFLPANV